MKRLIAATLAVTLMGTVAASAQPYHHGYGGSRGGWHGRNDGALIGLGIGLFALGAIAASANRDRYYDRAEYGPPPPPPPAYGPAGYGPQPAYYGPRPAYGYGY